MDKDVHAAIVNLLKEAARIQTRVHQLYARFLTVERRADHLLAAWHRQLGRSRQVLARVKSERTQ